MNIFRRPRPILFWLRWLVVIAVVPAWLTAVLTFAASYHRERATLEKDTVATAHAVMEAVDGQLAAVKLGVLALATSPHLDKGDIAAFREQALEVLRNEIGYGIVLTDVAGQQLMNTLQPLGEPLPPSGAPDLVRAVVTSAQPVISDLFVGAVSHQPLIGVAVPVIRDRKVAFNLIMGIRASDVSDILRAESLPDNWAAEIFDNNGNRVALRSRDKRVAGVAGTPDLVRRIHEAREGTVRFDIPDGTSVHASFSRSRMSGLSLVISIPVAELTADLRRQLGLSVAVAGVIGLLALLTARRLSLRIAGAFEAFRNSALALASGNLPTIPRSSIAELDTLGQSLHRARELIEEHEGARNHAEAQIQARQGELARVSRISLAGEMAAGIAHELSLPLTAITAQANGCVKLLARPSADREALQNATTEVVLQAERAAGILTRLRDFVRQAPTKKSTVVAASVIETAVALVAADAKNSSVEIATFIGPNVPPIFVDRIQIEQVLVNLLRNGVDSIVAANAAERRVVVQCEVKQGEVEISVSDTGPGVSDGFRDTIFQPFVTTKTDGLGMGLSISRTIIESHGGRLWVSSDDQKRTTFVFRLPILSLMGQGHAA